MGGVYKNMELPFQPGGWRRLAPRKREMCFKDVSWILTARIGSLHLVMRQKSICLCYYSVTGPNLIFIEF